MESKADFFAVATVMVGCVGARVVTRPVRGSRWRSGQGRAGGPPGGFSLDGSEGSVVASHHRGRPPAGGRGRGGWTQRTAPLLSELSGAPVGFGCADIPWRRVPERGDR